MIVGCIGSAGLGGLLCHSCGSGNPSDSERLLISSFLRKQEPSDCAGTLLRRPTHVPVGSARIQRAGHFSLSGQREVTKRKATQRCRSPGILPCDCARGLRGSRTAHPAPTRTGPRPAGHPSGYFLHPRAATDGTRFGGSPCRRSGRNRRARRVPLWLCFALLCSVLLILRACAQ